MTIISHLSRILWQQKWFKPEYGRSVYKRICRDEEAPDYFFSKDFYGLCYEGNLKNTIEFNIFYYGAFEKPLLHFLRDTVNKLENPDSVFLDVGSNIGQHALFMSQRVGHVHAFEPFAKVSDRLEHHITLNHLANIDLHCVGLSDTKEQKTFYAPTGRNQGIGSFDPDTTSSGNQAHTKLSLVRGDDYLLEKGIDSVDLVKIDVEGYEKPVLAGLRETLDKTRPIVVCEITYGRDQSFKSIDEIRQAFPKDYQFYTFDTRKQDGSKARREGAKSRLTGEYRIVPYHFDHPSGQDDIVACPVELQTKLPMGSIN